ncbi:hypothetical protein [Dactylosporangium sp. NPDC000521]|uniref:hypothetical protein n=1 Tax=Dactylosporangium sp. NPDC000521 TaxID=3363975 RepID=UPI0036CB2FFE
MSTGTSGGAGRVAAIRLPVAVDRVSPSGRGGWWRASLDLDLARSAPYTATARSAGAARGELAEAVSGALLRQAQRPVVVIGGGDGYTGCVHLILAESYGWVVHAIRDGRAAGSWHSDHNRADLLRQVLDHVGGTPAVVRL